MDLVKRYKCIIVEDEPRAREVLHKYICKVPVLEFVQDFGNAIDVISFLKYNTVDIIFLDIQMPELTGIDFIKTLIIKPAVIITSAYPEYAIHGFDLDVKDYLLKPIQFERFLRSINKVTQVEFQNKESIKINDNGSHEEGHLFFRADRKMVKVILNDILYVEAMKNYVKLITLSGTIITKNSITSLEAMLPTDVFIRVHKSFIVSRSKIQSFNHEIIEIGNTRIPIGKLFRESIIKSITTKRS